MRLKRTEAKVPDADLFKNFYWRTANIYTDVKLPLRSLQGLLQCAMDLLCQVQGLIFQVSHSPPRYGKDVLIFHFCETLEFMSVYEEKKGGGVWPIDHSLWHRKGGAISNNNIAEWLIKTCLLFYIQPHLCYNTKTVIMNI